MGEVEQLEQKVLNLSSEDLTKFRAWFFEFDAHVWDQQIKADVKAGKLDKLAAKALAEFGQGKTRER